MKGPYTVEQQEKIYELTQKIAFFSWRLGGGVEAVEVLDQKCKDLMEYVGSVEKQRE